MMKVQILVIASNEVKDRVSRVEQFLESVRSKIYVWQLGEQNEIKNEERRIWCTVCCQR